MLKAYLHSKLVFSKPHILKSDLYSKMEFSKPYIWFTEYMVYRTLLYVSTDHLEVAEDALILWADVGAPAERRDGDGVAVQDGQVVAVAAV